MEVNGNTWKFTCAKEGTIEISDNRVKVNLL
jgi:hypothetical protein